MAFALELFDLCCFFSLIWSDNEYLGWPLQLFGLVNTLLGNSRLTAEKDLSIQRYAVIPLSPNSGLIGWVPNCDTLHHLIREYREARRVRVRFVPFARFRYVLYLPMVHMQSCLVSPHSFISVLSSISYKSYLWLFSYLNFYKCYRYLWTWNTERCWRLLLTTKGSRLWLRLKCLSMLWKIHLGMILQRYPSFSFDYFPW